METIQEFLSKDIIWGNAPLDWFRAATTFGTVFVLLSFLKIVGLKRYKYLKDHTKTELNFQFVVCSFLRKLNFFVAVIVASYASFYNLALPVKFAKISRKIFIVFVFIQILIWAINAINLYSRSYIYERLEKDPTSLTAANVFTLIAKIFAVLIVVLLMLDQMGFNITTLLAGLGVGGIAVALAVQNILGDIFASLTIVLDKPFKVGDTLLVNNEWGTIERVGLKNTRIRSINGNLLIVPNNFLLQNQIQNYTELKERRTLLNIGVLYETPIEKLSLVPKLIQKAVELQPHTRFDRATLSQFSDSSLNFEVTYYTEERKDQRIFDVRHNINMEIVKLFNENQIGFAYPTRTLYINNQPKNG